MSSIFSVLHSGAGTKVRTGELSLPHGRVKTPVFMPVGTNGTVKAIRHHDLDEMKIRLILGNTYHLYLRPGMDVIRNAGGLHQFSGWKHNILTDSGGFQVFSLAPFRKIDDNGVSFRSHIDGSLHRLTPEKVVRIQETLGSDIMMPLDICTSPGITYKEALSALVTTTEWAKRSRQERALCDDRYQGNLFGIIQGNFFKDLRKRSAEEIIELDFPGIALGGLSVGESYQVFLEFLEYSAELIPAQKPRYLMGIGTPEYILAAVENGIDLFDCVFPTRIARNGMVFTRNGPLTMKRKANEFDLRPLEENCGCGCCRQYSRSYIRHLFKAGEILGPMLATEHNLFFIQTLMEEIRQSIEADRFAEYKRDFLSAYEGGVPVG